MRFSLQISVVLPSTAAILIALISHRIYKQRFRHSGIRWTLPGPFNNSVPNQFLSVASRAYRGSFFLCGCEKVSRQERRSGDMFWYFFGFLVVFRFIERAPPGQLEIVIIVSSVRLRNAIKNVRRERREPYQYIRGCVIFCG